MSLSTTANGLRPTPEASPPNATSHDLLSSLTSHPRGQVSASVYETARVVALAPWLDGHDARLDFLTETQNTDGGWGRTDGYRLVPTLSATDAALSAGERFATVARRGLQRLHEWLRHPAQLSLPDTPAIEVILPALIESINARLALPASPDIAALRMPLGVRPEVVATLRAALLAGSQLPTKVLHSLEAAAPLPLGPRTVGALAAAAATPSSIGASPAATAAWLAALNASQRPAAALRYLGDVAAEHGGAVPSVVPITAFERAWVLSCLADADVPTPDHARRALAAQLEANLGDNGLPGGAGLPADADTTSVALLTLEQLGRRPSLDCLLGYEGGTHFKTWPGERTPSVTTNAHVLDILSLRLCFAPEQRGRFGAARDRTVTWLLHQQHPDGSWTDKWHASSHYATAACAAALRRCADVAARPGVRRAVEQSIAWTLRTQREDGGWGRWGSTAEETAYAVVVLTGPGRATPAILSARRRAQAYLAQAYVTQSESGPGEEPALWHDKDLYRPHAVVEAAILAARHRLTTDRRPHAAQRCVV